VVGPAYARPQPDDDEHCAPGSKSALREPECVPQRPVIGRIDREQAALAQRVASARRRFGTGRLSKSSIAIGSTEPTSRSQLRDAFSIGNGYGTSRQTGTPRPDSESAIFGHNEAWCIAWRVLPRMALSCPSTPAITVFDASTTLRKWSALMVESVRHVSDTNSQTPHTHTRSGRPAAVAHLRWEHGNHDVLGLRCQGGHRSRSDPRTTRHSSLAMPRVR
jgi:hypothetical protein